MRIGLVELPSVGLIDRDGGRWSIICNGRALVSKQIFMANLQAGGFEPELVDLRAGTDVEVYGEVEWRGTTLAKTLVGKKFSEIDPKAYDAWGVTCNFTIDREVACMVINHLAKGGKPIVAGGSDVLGEAAPYFQAGATAVVTDKSGAANWAIFDYVLGRPPREKLTGVILADGTRYAPSKHPLHPEDWAVPSVELAKQCLGTEQLLSSIPGEWTPVGSFLPDIGCDRKCDFCQTPTYGIGYLKMSPKRVLQWLTAQKEAGARSVNWYSDQFLGRTIFPGGREEILQIMKEARELEMSMLWSNGLELKKATLGRGRNYDHTDLTPDEELIEAVWGWDGKVGCLHAYIPGERPVFGREAYAKLLPWQEHRAVMRAIVRAGVATIGYGVIVGLPEDSHDSLSRLNEALEELYQELSAINPLLKFQVIPNSICPLPGTPQLQNIRQAGLLRFEDPTLMGSFFTACADTNYISYEEVSDWQMTLSQIATPGYKSNFSTSISGLRNSQLESQKYANNVKTAV